mgnify:CR=1 FL=1
MIAGEVMLGMTSFVTGSAAMVNKLVAEEGVPSDPTSWIQFGAFSGAVALGAYLLLRSDRREKRMADEFQARLDAKDAELKKLRTRFERLLRQQMRGGLDEPDLDDAT